MARASTNDIFEMADEWVDAPRRSVRQACITSAKEGANAQEYTNVVHAPNNIPSGASVLPIYQGPLSDILNELKDIEVRSSRTTKIDQTIYLALCGGGGVVLGQAVVKACLGPLSQEEWEQLRPRHRVQQQELWYRDHTYGYELENIVRYDTPVPYKTLGGQTWQRAL